MIRPLFVWTYKIHDFKIHMLEKNWILKILTLNKWLRVRIMPHLTVTLIFRVYNKHEISKHYKELHSYLQMTLKLPRWPCIQCKCLKLFCSEDTTMIRILYFFSQWPWQHPNDLESRSRQKRTLYLFSQWPWQFLNDIESGSGLSSMS